MSQDVTYVNTVDVWVLMWRNEEQKDVALLNCNALMITTTFWHTAGGRFLGP